MARKLTLTSLLTRVEKRLRRVGSNRSSRELKRVYRHAADAIRATMPHNAH